MGYFRRYLVSLIKMHNKDPAICQKYNLVLLSLWDTRMGKQGSGLEAEVLSIFINSFIELQLVFMACKFNSSVLQAHEAQIIHPSGVS